MVTPALPVELNAWPAARLAGQMLVVGFEGTALPSDLASALRAGERAGVVLFRRNLVPGEAGLRALQALTKDVWGSSDPELPPWIAIDEEGGRVSRLMPPALQLPPMRRLAELDDEALLERVGMAVGAELRCLGVTLNFAPVVDVDTNPDNPIIGDRAFGRDAEQVVRRAGAYLRGLRGSGTHSCLKHFPGHGDTLLDSHLALPSVAHDRARLESVEILPFRRLGAQADSMMTAHVMYPALDPTHPATLSRSIATELLRGELGFGGVLFSDDLEMQAISDHHAIEASAIEAVLAGCDALLVCRQADAQARVHAALTRAVEREPTFRARALEAVRRGLELRRAWRPAGAPAELELALQRHVQPLAAELARRLDV